MIRREASEAKAGETKPVQAETPAVERGYLHLVPWLLLFAGSGCAALIYEIVWFQLLQLVIGSSAVSLGLLLAAYMGGLCLGSVALPRLVSTRQSSDARLRGSGVGDGGVRDRRAVRGPFDRTHVRCGGDHRVGRDWCCAARLPRYACCLPRS